MRKRKLKRRSRLKRQRNPGLTKAEKERLVKLYAIKIFSQEDNAPFKYQQRAHDKFNDALDKVLMKHGRNMMYSEEYSALEKAARNWWSKRAFRGAAVDW